MQGDVQLLKRGHGKAGEMVEKAAEVLMGCFRVCASDRCASQSQLLINCTRMNSYCLAMLAA